MRSHRVRGAFDLVAEARARIEEVSVDRLTAELAGGDALLVAVREQNERELEGVIPGALHAPRGMLEFWVDPTMDIHRPEFQPERRIIVHCAMGGRGALAADMLTQMGLGNVASLAGRFAAWKTAGRPIAPATESPEAPAQRTSRRLSADPRATNA